MDHLTSSLGTGIYTVPETARLVGLQPQRVRRWVNGYEYLLASGERRKAEPLVKRGAQYQHALNFDDLIELRFVSAFLTHGVSIQTIRKVIAKIAARVDSPRYPLTAHRLVTDGTSIMERVADECRREHLIDMVDDQVMIRKIVEPLLAQLDYDLTREQARAWFPLGKRRPVVIDPARSMGEPVGKTGGVPTRIIYAAKLAGQSVAEICDWYEVPRAEVRAAIEFEKSMAEN